MRQKSIPIVAIIAGIILIIPIGISALQHQHAYAPRECGQCVEFRKITHEFEKTVIAAISEGTQDDENEDIDAFAIFMRSTFGPNPEIDDLLADYIEGVKRILSSPPPDDGRPQEQIKEFRQLTHAFEKAVIGAFTGPE